MLCRNLGRHTHIDYCRSADTRTCRGTDIQHINVPMVPHPDRAKDHITHENKEVYEKKMAVYQNLLYGEGYTLDSKKGEDEDERREIDEMA